MTTLYSPQSIQRTSAVTAGISLIIMALAAAFSYGYVHSSLFVHGDAMQTLQNIRQSGTWFALEILGWLIIIITDLLVSWAFYVFLNPIHHAFSLLAGWLRLIYTSILAFAVSHLVVASRIAQEEANLFSDSIDMHAAQVMLSLTAFESAWSWGLIVFGLHLLAIGSVALLSRQIPKLISILVVIAGCSYFLIHLMDVLFPQLDQLTATLEIILGLPMIVGELGFGLWLLLKGRKLRFETNG